MKTIRRRELMQVVNDYGGGEIILGEVMQEVSRGMEMASVRKIQNLLKEVELELE